MIARAVITRFPGGAPILRLAVPGSRQHAKGEPCANSGDRVELWRG